MRDAKDNKSEHLLVDLTTSIVIAYLGNHIVPISELTHLIADVHAALSNAVSPIAVAAAVQKRKPAVAVRKSVHNDHITCLECGEKFKSLKRHLLTFHRLSPEEYREKWDLPAEYPMVAPTYAEARSQLAREMGLGQKRDNN
jgi:predicted transcriptional regulator